VMMKSGLRWLHQRFLQMAIHQEKKQNQFINKKFGEMSPFFQETKDTEKVFYNIKYREEKLRSIREETPFELPSYDDLTLSYNYFEQREQMTKSLDEQIEQMFEYVVEEEYYFNPYPPPVNLNQKTLLDSKIDSKLPLEKLYKAGEKIDHPDGFHLQIRKSIIDHPSSGYGLFVIGKALAGTVLAIYPGNIYMPSSKDSSYIEENEYIILRYDHIRIDGLSWIINAHKERRDEVKAELLQKEARHRSRYCNPFGIANYINHPGLGYQPNSMPYGYDFLTDWPDVYQQVIPHQNPTQPTYMDFQSETVAFRSVIVIATRDLEDEEVTMDYRYNPRNPYPPWYFPVDELAARRRWAPVRYSFFSKVKLRE